MTYRKQSQYLCSFLTLFSQICYALDLAKAELIKILFLQLLCLLVGQTLSSSLCYLHGKLSHDLTLRSLSGSVPYKYPVSAKYSKCVLQSIHLQQMNTDIYQHLNEPFAFILVRLGRHNAKLWLCKILPCKRKELLNRTQGSAGFDCFAREMESLSDLCFPKNFLV